MDVDDDDEYMNAAAAHASFVMTVSAEKMYWVLWSPYVGQTIIFLPCYLYLSFVFSFLA